MNFTEFLSILGKYFTGKENTPQPIKPAPPKPKPSPEIPDTKTVNTWRNGISDDPRHSGEIWIIPDAKWADKLSSISIGGVEFHRQSPYKNSEIWYGKPAEGYIIAQTKTNNQKLKSKDIVKLSIESDSATGRIPLTYYRRTNGNRPTYYTYTQRVLRVGNIVTFKIGDIKRTVTCGRRENGSIGSPYSSGGSSQLLIKNSDVRGRGICVLTPSSENGNQPGYIVID